MTKINLTRTLYAKPKREPIPAEKLVCYAYHKDTGEYTGRDRGHESPREPGVIHWPAYTTLVSPPGDLPKGKVWVWATNNWIEVEDHRGEIWYDTDLRPVTITGIGSIPAQWTQEDFHETLQSILLSIEEEKQAELQAELEAEWERKLIEIREAWFAKHPEG